MKSRRSTLVETMISLRLNPLHLFDTGVNLSSSFPGGIYVCPKRARTFLEATVAELGLGPRSRLPQFGLWTCQRIAYTETTAASSRAVLPTEPQRLILEVAEHKKSPFPPGPNKIAAADLISTLNCDYLTLRRISGTRISATGWKPKTSSDTVEPDANIRNVAWLMVRSPKTQVSPLPRLRASRPEQIRERPIPWISQVSVDQDTGRFPVYTQLLPRKGSPG